MVNDVITKKLEEIYPGQVSVSEYQHLGVDYYIAPRASICGRKFITSYGELVVNEYIGSRVIESPYTNPLMYDDLVTTVFTTDPTRTKYLVFSSNLEALNYPVRTADISFPSSSVVSNFGRFDSGNSTIKPGAILCSDLASRRSFDDFNMIAMPEDRRAYNTIMADDYGPLTLDPSWVDFNVCMNHITHIDGYYEFRDDPVKYKLSIHPDAYISGIRVITAMTGVFVYRYPVNDKIRDAVPKELR